MRSAPASITLRLLSSMPYHVKLMRPSADVLQSRAQVQFWHLVSLAYGRGAGRGVGTQNYTSSSTSQYVAGGAVADLYLQNGTKVGRHYFINNSAGGISPVFARVDNSVRLFSSSGSTARAAR